jgi:hypothetical protein
MGEKEEKKEKEWEVLEDLVVLEVLEECKIFLKTLEVLQEERNLLSNNHLDNSNYVFIFIKFNILFHYL